MVELSIPDLELYRGVNDVTVADFPRFARVTHHREPPQLDDVAAATHDAVESIDALAALPRGAEVAVTAGSRGIHDMPTVLAAAVEALEAQGLAPFIMPAMGSHGGATAEGQVETLESLGVTPDSVGCEIRSSMDVEQVATDDAGRPVYAAVDALEADGVLLANRVKLHTDYRGPIESGLAKMAVVGLGKHRGAEAMHNAALADGFHEVIPERAALLIDETPVVGGLALLENANERAAAVVGLTAEEILDREPELLERSETLFATLPIDDLDLLVLDEMGKEVSGTGMDTNVIGRNWFHNQAQLDSPAITRIYVRSLTDGSHGNGLGMGLADFAHEELVEALDLNDTYVNLATSGEAARGRIPIVVPADEAAFMLSYSMTGVRDPADLRVARIQNTLEPDELVVSEPVAAELQDRPDITVGELRPLTFENGRLPDVFGDET